MKEVDERVELLTIPRTLYELLYIREYLYHRVNTPFVHLNDIPLYYSPSSSPPPPTTTATAPTAATATADSNNHFAYEEILFDQLEFPMGCVKPFLFDYKTKQSPITRVYIDIYIDR